MNSVIKDIINSGCKPDEKIQALDLLVDDIEMARGILSGKYRYCPKCDDYYLSRSWFRDNETREAKICTYDDPINSGGNEYADGFIKIVYSVCPKGHKYEEDRSEQIYR